MRTRVFGFQPVQQFPVRAGEFIDFPLPFVELAQRGHITAEGGQASAVARLVTGQTPPAMGRAFCAPVR